MSALVANCPSCGGPVEFKSGQSIVVVCQYCRSAVARTDRDLKDLGKVAELIETGSPLDIGLRGTWKDVPFELTGRAQLGHEMGGQWDEWYATFSNGWLGWLAEAQGRFYITFQYPIPKDMYVPTFEQLQLGQQVPGLPWPTMPTTPDVLARLQIRYREIPIVFADSRKFAEEWTYRFLATALADLGTVSDSPETAST